MKRIADRLGLSETARVMCAAVAGLFALLLAAGLLVTTLLLRFEAPTAYGLGLLLGSAHSLAKVVLLERSLSRAADMEEKGAKLYGSLQAVARYVLTIAVLLAVVLFRGVFGPIGAILGILSLQFAAYITGGVMRRRDSANPP